MFKKKNNPLDEDWNIWDDEQQEQNVEEDDSLWGYDNFNLKKKVQESELSQEKKYDKNIIIGFVSLLCIISFFIIGYVNTDFDSYNNGYVRNFNIRYERAYYETYNDYYNYFCSVDNKISKLIPQILETPTQTMEEISILQSELKAKATTLAKNTRVPLHLENYNNQLVSFSESTYSFLGEITTRYNTDDYSKWVNSAYNDFKTSLNKLGKNKNELYAYSHRNIKGIYGGGDGLE